MSLIIRILAALVIAGGFSAKIPSCEWMNPDNGTGHWITNTSE